MIEHFIITVLVIYGIHASTRSGMILGWLNQWVYDLISGIDDRDYNACVETSLRSSIAHYITKVLFDCTPCMASVYGTLSFFLVFPRQGLVFLPVWVFSLCGFNFILNKIINR